MGQLYPWEGASYEERINKEASDYKKQWMEVTGEDPDSPEYKAKEARLLDYLNRPRLETEEQKREKIVMAAHQAKLREKEDLVKKRRERNRRPVRTRR